MDMSMTPTATNISVSDSIKPLQDWLAALNPDDYLYAVISAASEAEPVRYYFQLDGATIAWPLYANTPYADWHPVMPYLVKLSRTSPFLDWVSTTESTDWGWLFSSTQEADELAPHFSSLTQATMPEGDRVFFRYWDGDYFSLILSHQHEQTCSLIPAISACWVNGHTFSFQPDNTTAAKPFSWWHVPQLIIDTIEKEDHKPLIENMQEIRGDIWLSYTNDILKTKVSYFVKYYNGIKENLFSELCQQLTEDLKL
jgi:hypothetical protein